MPVAGEASCVHMGADCTGTGWPEAVDGARRTLYVRPGAAGDGSSRERPLGTVSAAIATAEDGDVIALAEGVHAPFRVTRIVHIVGACTAKTFVATATENLSRPTVDYLRGGGIIEGLTIRGPAPGVLLDSVTAGLIVRNVAIKDAARWGFGIVRGSTGVSLDHVVLDGISTGTPTGGRGFEVSSGGTIRMSAVTVLGTHGFGCALLGGSTLEADHVAVVGVAALASPGAGGQGLSITGSSKATIRHAVVRETRELGILAAGSGTQLSLEDASVEAIDGAVTGDKGYGIRIERAADVSLRRTHVRTARAAGVIATTRSVLSLEDVTVRETRPQGDGDLGIALAALGARVEGTRLALEDSRAAGFFVAEASTVTLAHTIVRRVAGRELDATLGMGALIGGASRVTLAHTLVEDARTVGIAVAESGSHLSLAGALLRRIRSSNASGFAGGGLAVGRGASVEASSLEVLDVQDYGVLVAGDDAHGVFDGLTVERVGLAECARAESGCLSAGIGILQVGGGLEAGTFKVSSCGIGLVVFDPKRPNDPRWIETYGAASPRIAMHGGTFTKNGVGVNVQSEGIDPAVAFVDVESFDNASGDFTSDAVALDNPSASFDGLSPGDF